MPETGEQDAGSIATSVTLASSASVLRVGSPFKLTATVTASGQRPRGLVVFRRGGLVMGSARLDDDGRAVLNVPRLPQGTHTVSAEFAPTSDFTGSRSRSLMLFVTP